MKGITCEVCSSHMSEEEGTSRILKMNFPHHKRADLEHDHGVERFEAEGWSSLQEFMNRGEFNRHLKVFT